VISARFLAAAERIVLADLHRAGHTVRQIAIERDRSPSRFSRDLRRNLHVPSGTYRPPPRPPARPGVPHDAPGSFDRVTVGALPVGGDTRPAILWSCRGLQLTPL
jgi:hypothetical protein